MFKFKIYMKKVHVADTDLLLIMFLQQPIPIHFHQTPRVLNCHLGRFTVK